MPEISRFFNSIIRINNCDTGQHHLPHIHAIYGEYEAAIGLDGIAL